MENKGIIVSGQGKISAHQIAVGDHASNRATSAGDGAAISQQLAELRTRIEGLAARLPPQAQASVSRDLRVLEEEAGSAAPRRAWYDLSAQGIVEAAKTCADLVQPVAATIAEIRRLLFPGQ